MTIPHWERVIFGVLMVSFSCFIVLLDIRYGQELFLHFHTPATILTGILLIPVVLVFLFPITFLFSYYRQGLLKAFAAKTKREAQRTFLLNTLLGFLVSYVGTFILSLSVMLSR